MTTTTKPTRVLSEAEAELGSFHDCQVHGLRWRMDRYNFSLDLQYLLEWIPPVAEGGNFTFRIAEARLTFEGASELTVSMDWNRCGTGAEISELRVVETGTTPNGTPRRYFEIEFSNPDALIALWSTGYTLTLLGEPVLSDLQRIPIAD